MNGNQPQNHKLHAEHVSVFYEKDKQDFLAVDDVSLSIQEAEFVVIVGPSGCGEDDLHEHLCRTGAAGEGESVHGWRRD